MAKTIRLPRPIPTLDGTIDDCDDDIDGDGFPNNCDGRFKPVEGIAIIDGQDDSCQADTDLAIGTAHRRQLR